MPANFIILDIGLEPWSHTKIAICFNIGLYQACIQQNQLAWVLISKLLKLTTHSTVSKKYYSNQRQGDMRQDLMTLCYKPSYTHRITVIPSPILRGLHLRDPWLGCKGSWVWNWDKTSWLLFLLLSSFIHPSLPSHIKAQSCSMQVRVNNEWKKCTRSALWKICLFYSS